MLQDTKSLKSVKSEGSNVSYFGAFTNNTTSDEVIKANKVGTGIYRDKTMADKLMYIPNVKTQNYSFYRLKLLVKTFKHSTLLTNQSKFTKVPKVFKPTNNKKLLGIKLWGLV